MNENIKNILYKSLILMFMLMFSYFLLDYFRYEITPAGDNAAYKLDRLTGNVLFLSGPSQYYMRKPK